MFYLGLVIFHVNSLEHGNVSHQLSLKFTLFNECSCKADSWQNYTTFEGISEKQALKKTDLYSACTENLSICYLMCCMVSYCVGEGELHHFNHEILVPKYFVIDCDL